MSDMGFWGGYGRQVPPPPAPPRPLGRRAPRAGRGDMQASVLALLAEEDMHGYQIIRELAVRSGGAWRPGGGSVYPTLRALQEQGLIEGRTEGSKQMFTLTELGRQAAEASGDEPAPWEELAHDEGPRAGLREDLGALFTAVGVVEQNGTDDEVEQACAILRQARRSVYRMLAGEDQDA